MDVRATAWILFGSFYSPAVTVDFEISSIWLLRFEQKKKNDLVNNIDDSSAGTQKLNRQLFAQNIAPNKLFDMQTAAIFIASGSFFRFNFANLVEFESNVL